MKTYIGEKETKWLFVMLFTSRAFVGAIHDFISFSGSIAYLNVIVCTVLVFLFLLIVNKINPCMKDDLFSMMRFCYGKPAAVALGTVLTALSFLNTAVRLRMFADAVKGAVLPSSPVIYILLFFAAAAAAVLLLGAEPITRYGYVSAIVIFFLTAIICLFNVRQYNVSNLYPHGGEYVKKLSSGTSMIYMFSDVLYLYIISGFFKSGGAVKRIGIRAAAVSGIAVTLLVLFCCALTPYPATLAFKYSFFRLASLAKSSVVLQRLDGLVYIIWIFTGFVSVGALALFTLITFSETFDTSDTKGTLPLTVFVIVVLAYAGIGFEKVLNILLCAAAFLLPAVTAAVCRIKMKGRKSDES